MTSVAAPNKVIALAALVPDIVRSCVIAQPAPPPDPGEEPPAPVPANDIYTPVAPGVTYAALPTVTIIDTTPTQIIGCAVEVAPNPQGRLDALFPSAVSGDGVIDRATNDIWVYNGSSWDNVGPTPGPTPVVTNVIAPWNEILPYDATVRTKLTVTLFAYALALLTTAAIKVRTKVGVRSVTAYVEVGVTNLNLAAATPGIGNGYLAEVNATALGLSAHAPAIAGGGSVSTPPSTIAVVPLTPQSVGSLKTEVLVPSGAVIVEASTPAVASGASMAVPAVGITMAGLAPSITVVVTDPNFSSVSLLLHLDGSNGATTFTDNSSNGFTMTAGGNAQLNTTVTKFGTAAVIWDSTGDFLRTPSNAAFTFGTGDFTIEFWSYFDASFNTGASAILMSIGAFRNIMYISNTLRFRSDGGTNLITGGALSLSTWYHIALTKSGNDHRLFIDGTQTGSTYTNTSSYTADRITFGANNTGANNYLGSMDEIRVTKGVARYTSNFTAPTQAFPDS